jgi:uncharacterized Tic20 family protein
MASVSDTTKDFVHIYRLEWWRVLAGFFSLIFMVIILGSPLFLLITSLSQMSSSDSAAGSVEFSLLCLLVPISALMSFLIIIYVTSFIGSLFSYIKTTPSGIEQRQWPYKHIRCNWSDVDRIGKYWLLYDTVYLKSFEIIGLSISLKMPFRLFRPSQNFMILTSYTGWANGQLANDLRQFAPQLFEPGSDHQASMLETPPHPSGLSQEERLLATLAHVSVLFSYIGIIVPIIIWATQKNKSSYIKFQALQALVWQAIMFMFNLIIMACIVCSSVLPILMMGPAQNETTPGFMIGFLVVMGSSLFLTIGSLFFIVYGIVGAVMTYQGKDFRYAIIANRLEKKGLGYTKQK